VALPKPKLPILTGLLHLADIRKISKKAEQKIQKKKFKNKSKQKSKIKKIKISVVVRNYKFRVPISGAQFFSGICLQNCVIPYRYVLVVPYIHTPVKNEQIVVLSPRTNQIFKIFKK